MDVLTRAGSGEALGGAGVFPVLDEVAHCPRIIQIVSQVVKKLKAEILILGQIQKQIQEANFYFAQDPKFCNAYAVFKGASPASIAENVNVRAK